MTIKMLINAVDAEEYRVAVIKDGQLDGFHIETSTAEEKVGNIYKAVIESVKPSIQACFVDYGDVKNGFLSAPDVHPEYYLPHEDAKGDQSKVPPIEKVLKKGQEVLVQVSKEMPGRKGATLTTYVSLASRYLVLTPGKVLRGVSKKIEDEEERARLKEIMAQHNLPEGVGFIVRTAGLGQNKRELSRDLNRLLRMWTNIRQRVKEAPARSLIHKEQDVCLRTLRDYFTGEISEILVDDKEIYGKVKDYMKVISPSHQRRVKLYKEKRPIFAHYEIEKQLQTLYGNRVKLKSGGGIVIDSTEALISIDVNSGRSHKARDVESTAFQTNQEAAAEIARQLRLRDMGGLVVIDFIDMRERNHMREVERLLREETKKDRAKIDLGSISKFGLLELSRQRLRPSIESRSYQSCAACQGRGLVLSVEAAAVSFLRQIWQGVSSKGVIQVNGVLPLEVATYLQNRKRRELSQLEERHGVSIDLRGNPFMGPSDGKLEFLKEEEPEKQEKTDSP